MNSTITINIKNTTSHLKTWYAFGYNQSLQNEPGVLVTVSESSLQQSTRESSTQPFIVKKIKIKTDSAHQLNQPISIVTSKSTGGYYQQMFTPSNYQDVLYSIPNLVSIYNPKLNVFGNTFLWGTINPNESMNIVLLLKAKQSFGYFISTIFSNIFGKRIKITSRFID